MKIKLAFSRIAFYILFLMGTMIFAQTGQGTNRGKIVIAYFSMPETGGTDAVSEASRLVVNGQVTGNVQFVASTIQKAIGGDLFVIKAVQTYPGSHNALLEYAQNEQKTNARPRLATRLENIQDYDTIFLGYPIWWYDLPMVIYSFLEEYDLAGKTIIPFTVHGGSRLSGTIEKIIQLEPRAKVINDGLAISRNSVSGSERAIAAWLRKLGY
jgi:flavodoxin